MSVDTDDGRRSKRGYGRTRFDDVDVYVASRLDLYADWARIDLKRSLFGQRLSVAILHKAELDCPE